MARTALQEVRATVSGYRQPTLASELRGAAEMLAAAGVMYDCEGADVALPPSIEAVLAWVVREGVTNVIRHSRATRCTVRISQEEGGVRLEIANDGRPVADTALFWPNSRSERLSERLRDALIGMVQPTQDRHTLNDAPAIC